MTRRTFLHGTGYALAVLPIGGMAITTPDKNLQAGPVTIPVGTENMPGFAARPKKAGSYPVVLVIHEIFGVHEYIKDVCRRLAAKGYYAICPDLYFRHGDATKIEDIETLRTTIVSKATQPQVLSDLDATVKWLGTDKAADAKRLHITGFCWGGNVTWMYASHNPAVKSGVAWYGRLAGEASAAQPRYPLDIAEKLTVPVLGLYAENDKGIPLDSVEKMRAALGKGKSGSKIIVYPGTEHGFHADYRPMYNEKAAKQGWDELLGWFKASDSRKKPAR